MKKFFDPQAIAVVGASANPAAIGGKPIQQLLAHGYGGKIYPVNPKREMVQDLRCFPSLGEVPGPVDLVIVAVAATRVAQVIAECGQLKIPYAVILSSGFADAGAAGQQAQEDLLVTARDHGVRLLGPNCVGFIGMNNNLYAGFGAFFDYEFSPGSVGFVTQSGGVGGSLLTVADEAGVNFGHFVHTGNAADMDIETLLEAFIEDPKINTLLAYVEGLGTTGRFSQIAYEALRANKPLLVWKAGQHESSASAVVSHTGRMAGNMERYRAVFEKYGVIEVNDTIDMVDVLRLAQGGVHAAAGRVGVVSVSGGAGVIAADYLAVSQNLSLAEFDDSVVADIAAQLPSFATARNPIDVTAQIFNEPDLFERVVAALTEHDTVDQVLACVASVHSAVGTQIAQAIASAKHASGVPIVVSWSARESLNKEAFDILREAGVPVYASPERALKALDKMADFSRARKELHDDADPRHAAPGSRGNRSWARSVEFDVLNELKSHGVSIPEQLMVSDEESAVAAARKLGFPLVIKAQSPDIPHKVDAGCVHLGLRSEQEVVSAVAQIRSIVAQMGDIDSRGLVVQGMVNQGVELILGYIRDESLGGFLLIGKGGSGVEQMDDRVLVPTPANLKTVIAKIRSLRVTVEGNIEEQAIERIAKVALSLQNVVAASDTQLREIEINPVIITGQNVTAVDALAI
ncbi:MULTISPECIES: acetate--CoA ligase family protein [unclassified Arthrobacter]|uniref:acetate--CoA ligase family protein n=1 Tax=unclassified Arthrobacter TaxID=235627 RepID=UPI0015E34E7E|nr:MULTISPECIES: acetate--CoA ligase family protein [unclassified Arthrobacter]